MASSDSPLIHPKDINRQKSIIIDARSGPDAYERYKADHLEGALYVDLDLDLSEKPRDPAYGGRHPLPDLKDFSILLGKLGITPLSHIVVYDDKSGANAAARFWWMLRAVGHKTVQVVDGGLDSIVREKLPMSSSITQPGAVPPYPVLPWKNPTVSLDDVQRSLKDNSAVVIDVREGYRYRGEKEPIDLIAGHIPGAVNMPFLNSLSGDGRFLPAEELANQFNTVLDGRRPSEVIVHCGSGVTACHTLLAMEQARLGGASLYVGSWSEWSRRELPIATGDR